jgi:predicted TIM-barrel fold metal-dependent hydrolase
VLSGITSYVGAAVLRGKASAAQATPDPRRIDVHHHFAPPVYLTFAKARSLNVVGNWKLAADLEDMDRGGTATAILTITAPGFGVAANDEVRKTMRSCNEAAAKLRSDYPRRFGSFAALPLTDTEGTLKEIEYALDSLKADGVCLFSNYGDRWLGHPSFAPVYEELNRRKVVTYVHPITAHCCGSLLPSVPNEIAMIEFGTDTTRTIADLIFSGTTTRFPEVVWIFSHGGGVMPFLIERLLQGTSDEVVPGIVTKGMDFAAPKTVPKGVMYELRKMYYDTAQATNPVAMDALRKVVPVSQILYGTDYWYRTAAETAKGLTTNRVFNDAELRAINRGNIETILPRYKS